MDVEGRARRLPLQVIDLHGQMRDAFGDQSDIVPDRFEQDLGMSAVFCETSTNLRAELVPHAGHLAEERNLEAVDTFGQAIKSFGGFDVHRAATTILPSSKSR